MKKILIPLFCLLFFLVSCGESNPILGKWVIDTEAKPGNLVGLTFGMFNIKDIAFEFTKEEVILYTKNKQERDKIRYEKKSDNLWTIVSIDEGKTIDVAILKEGGLQMGKELFGVPIYLKKEQ